MDCKIITRLFFLIFCFIPTHSIAIEFTGKFLQGHFIIGKTDPTAKIIIDKKQVKVSDDGFFVFGLDRDRKFDLTITKIVNGKKEFMDIALLIDSFVSEMVGFIAPIQFMTKLGFVNLHKSSKLSLVGSKLMFSPFNSLINLFSERNVKKRLSSE